MQCVILSSTSHCYLYGLYDFKHILAKIDANYIADDYILAYSGQAFAFPASPEKVFQAFSVVNVGDTSPLVMMAMTTKTVGDPSYAKYTTTLSSN